MKVFVCNDHEGHWSVPTASVIVAESEDQARQLLIKELESRGIKTKGDFTLQKLKIHSKTPFVEILSDGDY